MTNKQSHDDGSLGDDELRWLCSRADGGFGVVMTCAAHVAKDGQGWPGELGVFDDTLLPGLATLASALRERGAVSVAQIFHGGLRADPAVSGTMPWSASAADGVREASEDDLWRVVEEFAAAAVRCEAAGFEGVELHGAHGYLFTQFLSTVQNQRADDWGGSLENRARLLREAVRAVRAAVGATFTVGVRLSPEDFGNASTSTTACGRRAGWRRTASTSCTSPCGRRSSTRPSGQANTRFRSSEPRCLRMSRSWLPARSGPARRRMRCSRSVLTERCSDGPRS
jgi:2,4-dienoyl-CoA reductase-like NADH-dependent reductase (Old Yellow Enzyme family)